MANQDGEAAGTPSAEVSTLQARVAHLEAQLATLEDVLTYQTLWLCRFRPDGTLIYVNQGYARDLLTNIEHLVGSSLFALLPPAERPEVIAQLATLGPACPVVSYEQRVPLPDGQIRWEQWTAHALLTADGQVAEIQAIGQDSTERKLAQKQLTAQRDLSQALAATSSLEVALPVCLDIALRVAQLDCGGFYLVDPTTGDLKLVFARNLSDAFLAKTSHWPADSDRTRLVLRGQPSYTPYDSVNEQLIETREALHAVVMLPLSHQGRVIGCLNLGSHVRNEVPLEARNALEAIAAQVSQAIVRIQTEAALRSSQQIWQSLFDSLQDFLFVLAQDGTILRVNQMVLQRLGYREEELLGQPVLMVHPPEFHADAALIVSEMLAGRRSVCPLALLTRNGKHIPVETKVTLGRWGNQDALFGVSRDVSAHRRIELALRESELRLRTLIHHLPNGAVFFFDPDLRYLLADGEELAKLGLSAATVEGRTLHEVFLTGNVAQIEMIHRVTLAGRSPAAAELLIGDHWYHLYGVPIRDQAEVTVAGLIFLHNLTEQKQAQALLNAQAQRELADGH